MPYSLKQAATASGKSKPTILRAIQSGKISAEKDEQGEWQIEPAELHRVYPPVTERTASDETAWNDTQQADSPFETVLLRAEVEQMRERFSSLEIDRDRERREASDTITDLRRRLDQSEQERRDVNRQLTALLTDQRPGTEAPALNAGRGFRAWFRRRA
jgi:predicted RNase H-like nuclease (RuvC/YqgF family)